MQDDLHKYVAKCKFMNALTSGLTVSDCGGEASISRG